MCPRIPDNIFYSLKFFLNKWNNHVWVGISQEGKKTRSQMDSCVIAEKEFFYKTITLHTVYSYSCIAFKLLKLFSLLTLLDD